MVSIEVKPLLIWSEHYMSLRQMLSLNAEK